MRTSLLFAAFPVVAFFSIKAFDVGFYGIYPRQRFHSVDFEAPVPKITQWDPRCDSGTLLLSPRARAVSAPGPVMLYARGNLIWMEDKFEQAMNLNVQKYKGQDFMTFWMGTDHAAHSNG
jgi:hypothetical protein